MSLIGLIFGILGSLGVFLFGMKVMSQGIQRVAGERLRRIMAGMTSNRVLGVTTGFLVTSVIQSSSASTVMVVSFVNASLLRLREAIGVIMGANLGTTTTFWIVSFLGFSKFSLSSLVMPVIAVGFPMIFSRKAKWRDAGEALIGFGLLFLGLSLLKEAVPDVQSNPEALVFIQKYTGYGFASVLLFLFFGMILTVVVQSSSVAGAITLTMAFKGWIDFEIAAAVVLGENIGTTITANLAALGANRDAKRAALAHLVFNLIGVCWMLLLFYPFTRLVQAVPLGGTGDQLPRHLALFHSAFNFCNILLLIGFVPQLERLVRRVIPGADETPEPEIAILSPHLVDTGELTLQEARAGLKRMGSLALAMYRGYRVIQATPAGQASEYIDKARAQEDESDRMADRLNGFLVQCATESLSQRSAHAVAAMAQVLSEIEELCDGCFRLSRKTYKLGTRTNPLRTEDREALHVVSDRLEQLFELIEAKLSSPLTPGDVQAARERQSYIRETVRSLRRAAINRLQTAEDPEAELLFIEVLSLHRRLARSLQNIEQILVRSDHDT